jgi:hypothetical protein
MTEAEAAAWLRIKPKTLADMRRRGAIPFLMVSAKQPRYLLSELMRHLEEGRQPIGQSQPMTKAPRASTYVSKSIEEAYAPTDQENTHRVSVSDLALATFRPKGRPLPESESSRVAKAPEKERSVTKVG